ncbi:MAG: helix-turn-helix transcriptional regulator [Alphaproteobacteria bacterium]|jgi:DNA-binding CsgD family transcriptional regulator|nr:helix-turn-helix transcriptional regulator [Alphaproteobacteria bacterium]MBT5389990.1 helix-turn-helix transcriptional regulator [Alphaproteobacteria bacterium]
MTVSANAMNKSTWKYNCEINAQLVELCEPLFKNFGITVFSYIRFFEDGTHLQLCTNTDWLKFYLQKKFYDNESHYRNMLEKIPVDDSNFVLWETLPQSQLTSSLYESNIWNGLSIYKRYKNYAEAFYFSSTRDSHQIIDFFVNHQALLTQYSFYFKEKASDFIINPPNEVITVPAKMLDFGNLCIPKHNSENRLSFFRDIEAHTPGVGAQLSCREHECISHISKGKTMKETACDMGLSPRTVEQYIVNVKKKFKCKTKSEVIEYFFQESDRPTFSPNMAMNSYP